MTMDINKEVSMNSAKRIVNWYFRRNQLPYWCIFVLDGIILVLSGVVSYWIFTNWYVMTEHIVPLLCSLMLYAALSVIGVRIFRTYSGIVRYSSFVDLSRVAYANGISLVISLGVHYLMYAAPYPPFLPLNSRHLIVMFVLATLLMWGMRVVVKTVYDVLTYDERALRVLIYGSMAGGVGLAKYIHSQNPKRFLLKGFISHDNHFSHSLLMGKKVYTIDDGLLRVIGKLQIEGVLVSPMRTDDFRNNQELQDMLIGAGCKIFIAQYVEELDPNRIEEGINSMRLKEVSVEDLLPRNQIKVDMKSVGEQLNGRRVLITGAAGSIGSEIVRQVAGCKPAAMMLIDQAETPEHDVRLMMAKEYPDIKADTVVTSICNQTRMERIFHEFRPEYVFHAAAYKHVPMMEDNPSEAVLNNIYGTRVIADLAVKYGVRKFVMISTDKAVNPTNVMGCSKRICEIYVQSLDRAVKLYNNEGDNCFFAEWMKHDGQKPITQFVTTRFGNVLGSNGSVIPLFREQIKNGGPVTVTHPDIIRFFMLIPEACKLVLEAGTKGNGGEIFVFDMGKPVRIADLAQRMIDLSGAKHVKIAYTGLRAGEKLYEEVLNELEGTKPTFHEKIRIAEAREYDYAQVCKDISELIELSRNYDDMETVKKMKEIVPEYKSKHSKYEKLDASNS